MEGKPLSFLRLKVTRIILSELFIDNKTIPPKEGLGVAGGAKYLCQGIYFKLALDVKLDDTTWLYGGSAANDEKGLFPLVVEKAVQKLQIWEKLGQSCFLVVHPCLLPP